MSKTQALWPSRPKMVLCGFLRQHCSEDIKMTTRTFQTNWLIYISGWLRNAFAAIDRVQRTQSAYSPFAQQHRPGERSEHPSLAAGRLHTITKIVPSHRHCLISCSWEIAPEKMADQIGVLSSFLADDFRAKSEKKIKLVLKQLHFKHISLTKFSFKHPN